MTETAIVDHLHYVTLALAAPPVEGAAARDLRKAELTFLYGIGTGGLTAFEQRLHGKTPGETLKLRIDKNSLRMDFEHLGRQFLDATGAVPPFDLDIEVKAVRRATDLEVVQALARQTESSGFGSGCGGACGCGC